MKMRKGKDDKMQKAPYQVIEMVQKLNDGQPCLGGQLPCRLRAIEFAY